MFYRIVDRTFNALHHSFTIKEVEILCLTQ